MKRFFTGLILVIIVIAFFAESAKSIPAFARKYRMSCQTCHNPIPRLKPYGDDFAGNAFRLEDKEAPRYYVETGDEELSLIRELMIAVRMDAHITYNRENDEKSDFGAPWLMKLLSGGELAPDLAYYFYFYFDEQGEIAGVEDAYLMFNDLFSSELDLYVGQFQVSDPLFKRELRLTLEDYELYKVQPGITKANLTYDKGIMLTYGFDFGLNLMGEIVNGNGLVEAEGFKVFDDDKYKNFMGRVSQDIGGLFSVGAFAYYGNEELVNDNAISVDNEILIWGPDVSVSFEDILQLNLQYLKRTDSDIYLTTDSDTPIEDLETEAALAELIVLPNGDDSKWYGVGLFNWLMSDDPGVPDYRTGTLHLGYMLRRNLRLTGEWTYDFSISGNEYSRFAVGFVSAF